MSRKWTKDSIQKEISKYSEFIEIVGDFSGINKKTTFYCKKDDYEWESTADGVLRSLKIGKAGCPRCSEKERYTPERFREKVYKINPDITLLTDYKNCFSYVKCKCNICGYEWETQASHLINAKTGCHKCHGVKQKTQEEFENEMSKKSPNIIILGKYINNKTKLKCQCKICGNIWEASPNALLRKNATGCPKCKMSHGEIKVKDYLESRNIEYIPQKTFDDMKYKHKLHFDFFLPKYNIAIEYDGHAHFFPVKYAGKKDNKAEERFELTKARDNAKNNYCKENNINLIRIPFTAFDHIEEILDKEIA